MSQEEIDALSEQSARNNHQLDVTGILMTSGRIFFQLLEGPPEAVEELYRKIVFDPRHTDILLLSGELVDERLFPDWAMRQVRLGADADDRLEPVRDMLSVVVAQRHQMEKLINSIERTIWRELARTD